ncbi:putative fibroblast growth factor 11 [Scophthalmus maximus]|uniref:Putative fibroblast growth factor 11 n=1 Tax=Scophthalmus maximus TaxID=52904 RepID=A0A2U9BAJ4_SCOMX|nr:putative fibroblast growth factor 11 [Scophthalmus maximus]
MAALASSLIRQRREVKDPQANRQIASKRKPCPKSNKSLCQKQILILISKVRLCGSRGRKMEKRPGEFPKAFSLPSCSLSIFSSSLPRFLPALNNWILMVDLPDYRLILNCKALKENIHSL